jgi:hypothetical protein
MHLKVVFKGPTRMIKRVGYSRSFSAPQIFTNARAGGKEEDPASQDLSSHEPFCEASLEQLTLGRFLE